jgi:hypothetical protein
MIIPLPGIKPRMASKLAPIAILILCALAICPACTSPMGGGGPSGGNQATSGGQSQPGTQGTIYPGPVVTVPPDYNVQIQENRNHNPVYPNIIVTFRGGKGQIFLQKIVATVVRSDGQVITKELDRPENDQIKVGDSMTFTGTTGIDRVIVVVTILAKDYKIIDMNDDYNSHP